MLLQKVFLQGWCQDNMFRLTPYRYNYHDMAKPTYAQMIADTDSELIPMGFTKETLGISEDGGFTLYGYKYGDFSKPTIWIDSNIHGSEWWTAYYCLDALKEIIGLEFFDRVIAQKVRDEFSWYYIPSLNPYGFENNQYTNVNLVNLNRNFDNNWESYVGNAQGEGNNYKGTAVWSESEARISRDKFLEILPTLAVNCHTTSGDRNGLDTQHLWRKNRTLMFDAMGTARLSIGSVGEGAWQTQFSSSAPAWYAKQFSKEGIQTTSTILESRSDTSEYNYGTTVLVSLLLTFYHRHKTGKQKLENLFDLKEL